MIKDSPELSLVIPCHNEEDNLRGLIGAISSATALLGISYEVIITDDGSTDHSWTVLKYIASGDSRVRVQRFQSQCGQSAAIWAGMQIARGQYIVTLDADLQNDLSDLSALLDALKSYDCVCGTRVRTRQRGDSFACSLVSRIANWVRNKILGDHISDSGCTYRAFKRECVSKIKFFRGAHRFLPALFKLEGFTVTEIPIKNNPRLSGRSHYGIRNRILDSIADLYGVWWMKNRLIRYEIAERIN